MIEIFRFTPYTSIVAVNVGERVRVSVGKHTAVVTGNVSSPAARSGDVDDLNTKVTEFESVVADKATVKDLEAQKGRIDDLVADNVTIKKQLTADSADIKDLKADNVEIKGTLQANSAEIDNLKSTKIDAEVVEANYATIKNLSAATADIRDLKAKNAEVTGRLEANEVDIKNLKSDTAEISRLVAGNTTPPTSGWSTSIPSVAQGQYLWTRVTTTYTDNSTSVSYSVAKQGSTGATGTTGSQWYAGTGITGTSTTATAFADSGVANARVNDMYLNTSTGNTYKCTVAGNATNAKWVYAGNIKGVQGDKGNTGATGNGISKADITYASSSSNTSAPTSGWQNTPPSVSPGQYLWTKTVFTYTNGGTATQYSVAKQGNTGAAGADAITVSITSSNGTVFKNNSGSTVLTAHG